MKMNSDSSVDDPLQQIERSAEYEPDSSYEITTTGKPSLTKLAQNKLLAVNQNFTCYLTL